MANGISLEEKERYEPPYSPGIDYDDPEVVENLHERQDKVHRLGPISAAVRHMNKRPDAKFNIDQPPKPMTFDPKQDGY